jgi:glycerophosphoryl diester phosphodiesterase
MAMRERITNWLIIIVYCVLAAAFPVTAVGQFNGRGCPATSWDFEKISRFATTSAASDGNHKMVCAHRGKHDWMSGENDIPENSADAIELAFEHYPCVEVDVGVLGDGSIGLYHDLGTVPSGCK